MGAHVDCPRCGQAYALSDEQALLYAGRDFECTQCGERFRISGNARRPSVAPAARVPLPREELTAGATRAAIFPSPDFIQTAGHMPLPRDLDLEIPGSGLAFTAVVLGLLALVAPLLPATTGISLGAFAVAPALLAILVAAIALMRVQAGKAEGATLAAGGIALGLAGLVLAAASTHTKSFIPRMAGAAATQPVRSDDELCAEHFRQIKTSLAHYAALHDGHFPDGLDAVVADGSLPPDALLCPLREDTQAAGASLAETAQHVREPGHCSYVYTGKGLVTTASPECVLVYETLDSHKKPGMSVLFVDGRTETIGSIEATRAIARLTSGINPPWSTPAK